MNMDTPDDDTYVQIWENYQKDFESQESQDSRNPRIPDIPGRLYGVVVSGRLKYLKS